MGRDHPRRVHSGRRNRSRQLEIRIVYHALCAHSQLVCILVCACRRAHHVLCACAVTFSRHMRAILRAKVGSCVPLASTLARMECFDDVHFDHKKLYRTLLQVGVAVLLDNVRDRVL